MPITDSTLQSICSKKQLRGLPLSEAVKKLTHLNLEDSGIKKIVSPLPFSAARSSAIAAVSPLKLGCRWWDDRGTSDFRPPDPPTPTPTPPRRRRTWSNASTSARCTCSVGATPSAMPPWNCTIIHGAAYCGARQPAVTGLSPRRDLWPSNDHCHVFCAV